MAHVGSLVINVVANTGRFTSGLAKAGRDTSKFSQSVGAASQRVMGLGAALTGIGSTAALGWMVKSQIQQQFALIDTLAKTSDKLGIQTEELGKLRYAAELSGVGVNTLDMALQRMTRRLSEAAGGRGESLGAIAELGMDAQRLAAMSPDKAFYAIAEAMSKVDSQSDKVRLSFKFFDSEGVALVNTLAMGETGLRAAGDEAERFGMLLNRIDAGKIEAANDAITRLKGAMKGLFQRAAVDLAPAVEGGVGVIDSEFARGTLLLRRIRSKMLYEATGLGTIGRLITDPTNRRDPRHYRALGRWYDNPDAWGQSHGETPPWITAKAALADRKAAMFGGHLMRLPYDYPDLMEGIDEKTAKWFKWEEDHAQKYEQILAKRDLDARLAGQTERQQAWADSLGEEQAKTQDAQTKAQDAWNDKLREAGRLYDMTRTPMERFKNDLAHIESLLSSGALKDPGVAARRFGELSKALGGEPNARVAQTFAPAMLRGSMQAYDAMVRQMYPDRMRDPAEDTAAAARKIVELFPRLAGTVEWMGRNQNKPGTVETAP